MALANPNKQIRIDADANAPLADVVEVVDGLEEGVEVVGAGAQNLNEGDRVRTQ